MNLRWNQILVSLLVGILIGAITSGSPAVHDLIHKWDSHSPQDRMLKRFAKRLSLSSEQKTAVATILDQKRTKMDAIFNEMKPKFEQVRKETGDDIRKLLNENQKGKFEAMELEMTDRFNKRFPPHH